jgi:hypothetical protein
MSIKLLHPKGEITAIHMLNQAARSLQTKPVGITLTGIKWRQVLIGYNPGLRKQ